VTVPGIHHVELGARSLERSRDFYTGLLGLPEVPPPVPSTGRPTAWFAAQGALLQVVELGDVATTGAWADDDLQAGMRHVGLKIGDVDAGIRRLDAAGVEVLSAPADVLGGVRIAFFLDPDGSRLEYVQGSLDYQSIRSPDLAAAERAAVPERTDGPRFDHVGLTVADLDAALDHYCGTLGYQVIGDIRHVDDARGFLMTYLQAGGGVLEVFSFDVPTRPAPTVDPTDLGLRGVGLLRPAGGTTSAAGWSAGADPDGVPLTWVPLGADDGEGAR
jgi:catechol 2,3-dioxygenase-like lactoylglutathione lyase family enzyme